VGAKGARPCTERDTKEPRCCHSRPALAGADANGLRSTNSLLDDLKALARRNLLNAEMDHHLEIVGKASNQRNGYGRRAVITDTRTIELEVPRDHQASFDPQLIAKEVPASVPRVRRQNK